MGWWEIVVRSRFYQMFLNSLSQSYILCDQLLYCLKANMGFWVIRNMASWNFNKRNSHYRFCKWLHWCSGGCFETVVEALAYFNIADRFLTAIIDATILFQNLSALGFKVLALEWIISFMSGRCQKWLDIEHKSQFEVSTDMCTLTIKWSRVGFHKRVNILGPILVIVYIKGNSLAVPENNRFLCLLMWNKICHKKYKIINFCENLGVNTAIKVKLTL